MRDFDWIDNELVRCGALRAAGAPAAWLARLGAAVVDRARHERASGTLDRFRRAPWMAEPDPLAALGRGIDASSSATADEAPADDAAQRPGGAGRPAPVVRPTLAGAQPDDHARSPAMGRMAGAGSLDRVHGPPGAQQAPNRGPALPGQAGTPAAADSLGTHRPLPAMERTTVSTQQLGALAGGRTQTSSGAGQPGTAGGARGAPAPRTARGQSGAAGTETPSGARLDGIGRPDRPPIAPSIAPAQAAQDRAAPRLPGVERAASAAPGLPASPVEAGAALLARLTEPAPPDVSGNAPEGSAEVARRAIAQAFRETIRPEALPAGQLAALLAGATRRKDLDRPDHAPSASAAAPVSLPGAPDAEPRPALAGLEGIALLRESLAGFSGAVDQGAPEPRPHVADSPAASAAPAATPDAQEHPHPPDLVAPSGSSIPADLPAVQNTFNVTVHMAGGMDNGEEELAERLTRILVEQARRYGIDI